jgi:hypothetical protein
VAQTLLDAIRPDLLRWPGLSTFPHFKL